jgi:hypothetical protein
VVASARDGGAAVEAREAERAIGARPGALVAPFSFVPLRAALAFGTLVGPPWRDGVWMHERWKTRPEPGAGAPQAKAMPKSVELSSD